MISLLRPSVRRFRTISLLALALSACWLLAAAPAGAQSVNVTLGDGSAYTPPAITPGTASNPIGRGSVTADAPGAVVTSITLTLDGLNQGVQALALWESNDDVFSTADDALIRSVALDPTTTTPTTVTFSATALNVPTGLRYIFLVADLTADADGDIQSMLMDASDIAISNGTITNPGSDFPLDLSSGLTSLPVELSGFDAQWSGERAFLQWETAAETDNAGFTVEHDAGAGWAALGFVPGAGTTDRAQRYRFTTGRLAPGMHRFRLVQVDTDGTERRTKVVTLRRALTDAYALSAYPNPAAHRATVALTVRDAQPVRVSVYDLTGRRVAVLYDGPVAPGSPLTLALNTGRLAPGTYFVRTDGTTFRGTHTVRVVR